MRKLVGIAVIFFFLLAAPVFGAGVGFVPSTRLWLSSDEATPGTAVTIYTVVINNNYPSLDASIAFYANLELVGTAQVIGLPKETARQVKAPWQPKEGNYTLSARFLRATAIDATGKRIEIDVSDLNTVADLTLRGSSVPPSGASSTASTPTSAPVPDASSGPALANEVAVIVKQEGEKLSIMPQAVPVISGTAVVDEFFAQNRQAIAKLDAAKAIVTTTLKQLSDVWEGAKTSVSSSKGYMKEGQAWWGKAEPIVEQGKAAWDSVSDHNNPRRLIILGVGALALFLIIRKLFRRRKY